MHHQFGRDRGQHVDSHLSPTTPTTPTLLDLIIDNLDLANINRIEDIQSYRNSLYIKTNIIVMSAPRAIPGRQQGGSGYNYGPPGMSSASASSSSSYSPWNSSSQASPSTPSPSSSSSTPSSSMSLSSAARYAERRPSLLSRSSHDESCVMTY